MIKFQFILLFVVFQSLLLMEMGLSLPMEKEKQFTPVDVCPKYSNFYGYQLSHQGCCLDELNCPVQLLAQNAMIKSKLQAISKERSRDEIKRRRKRSLIHPPTSSAVNVNPYVQKSAAHLLTLCRNNVSIINPVYATSATTHGHVQLVQLPPLLTQSIAVHTCEERETPIVRGSCIQHYKWESVYVVTPRKYEIVDSMSEYADSDEVTFKREWILVGAGCELRLYTDSGDFDSSYFHYPEYDKLPKPKINGLNYVHLKGDEKFGGANHGTKAGQQKHNGQYGSGSNSPVIPFAPSHGAKTTTVYGQQGLKAPHSPPKPPTEYSKPPATDSTPPTPAEYSPPVAPPTLLSPQPPAAYSSPEPPAAYSPPEPPAAYSSPEPLAANSPPEPPAAYSPPASLESSPPPEIAVPYSGPKPLEAYFPYELSQPTSPPKPPVAYSPPETPLKTDVNSETYSPLSPYKVPKINASGYNATLYALNLTKESTAYPPPSEPIQPNPPTDNTVAYPPSEMSPSVPQPETQTYPKPETSLYAPLDTQTYPQPETQIYTPPETQSQTYPQPEAQIYPEPETQIYTPLEAQSQTYPEPETQIYTPLETQSQTYPQPETQTNPQPETQTYPQPESQTYPQPESQTYPQPETPPQPQPSPEYPSIQRETNGNGTSYDIQNSNYTVVYVNAEGQPIGYGESGPPPPSPTTEFTSPQPSPAYPNISNYTTTNETSYSMETSNYTVVYVNESGNPIAYSQVAPDQNSNTSYPPGGSEGYNVTSDKAPLPQIYGRGKSEGEGSSQGSQIHGYRVPQGGAAPGQAPAPGQAQAPPPPSVAYHASPTTTEYINSGAPNPQEPGQYDGGRLIQNPGSVPPGGQAYAPWTNGQYPRHEYEDEEYPYISYPRDARNSGYSSPPAGGDVPRNPYAKPYRGVYTPPNKIGVPIYSMRDNPDRIHELMSNYGHP